MILSHHPSVGQIVWPLLHYGSRILPQMDIELFCWCDILDKEEFHFDFLSISGISMQMSIFINSLDIKFSRSK